MKFKYRVRTPEELQELARTAPGNDERPMQKPPELTACPQCRSDGCGPLRCRFSMIEHAEYQRIAKRIEKHRRMQAASAAEGVSHWLRIDSRRTSLYEHVADKLGLRLRIAHNKREHFTQLQIIEEPK